jgi:hypothetical protein
MGTGIRIIGDVHGKIDWNILGRPGCLDLDAAGSVERRVPPVPSGGPIP